ncbi:NAD-dependent epimerase/dehydratase family protein [Planctobacterium marinum]|uniref:NAD-dependent epimerase/dehydratase family protein n=1 Tax=Planctobacterium marinum TaxID=1631968 RepID=UPI001E3D5B75|nr:NAD-dependent epimerase/dehydratase family protein [Planctobacterium marinum]MCC2605841.1 NAD-dependent epimerase/dehydratase family protein [Planctobacterium marinum]
MATLIIGCDEFLGAELTRQLLASGDSVTGLSLFPWEQSETRTSRLTQLESNVNARHFTYVGNLGNLSEEVENKLVHINKVYFLPEFNAELAHQEFILHLTLKVLSLVDTIRPAHLVFGSHYCIYKASALPIEAHNTATGHPHSVSSAIVKAIESLLHGYCAQKQLPITVLRMFELYGKGASELNLISRLSNALTKAAAINVSEFENHILDYTHVADAAKILVRAMEHNARPQANWKEQTDNLSSSYAPWQIFNLGTGKGTSVSGVLKLLSDIKKQPISIINQRSSEPQCWVADATPILTHMGLQARTQLQAGLTKLFSDP